jgi:hypothetical protein
MAKNKRKVNNNYGSQVRAIQNASYGYSLVKELGEVGLEVVSGGINEALTGDLEPEQRLMVNGATTIVATLAKAAVPKNKAMLKDSIGSLRSGFSTDIGRQGTQKLKEWWKNKKDKKEEDDNVTEEENTELTQREMRLDEREKALLQTQKQLQKMMEELKQQKS